MSQESLGNLRSFVRTSVRASATVYVSGSEGELLPIRAWTDDVSPSGALVLTEEPIGDEPFCIRILLPGLENQLLECVCVRRGRTQTRTLSNLKEITRYSCGVEFIGVCNDPDLLAQANQ